MLIATSAARRLRRCKHEHLINEEMSAQHQISPQLHSWKLFADMIIPTQEMKSFSMK